VPTPTPTPTIAGTGNFQTLNGKIYDPQGKQYIAAGLNIGDPTLGNSYLSLFPAINFFRCAIEGYDSVASWTPFINQMTALKIVCEIEHHPWPIPNALQGSDLTTETAWYVGFAQAFQNNPYVWFGTMNEPQSGNGMAAISAQQLATYNGIRGAGNNSMILLEAGAGGGNPGQTGAGSGLTESDYLTMVNVCWDMHYYGWTTNYSTDVPTVENELLGSATSQTGILAAQAIKNNYGVIPVINAEFGVSTSGSNFDANYSQDITAVMQWACLQNHYTQGFSGWHWDADPYNAVQNNGVLTSWGQSLAAGMVSVKNLLSQLNSNSSTPTTPTKTPTTAAPTTPTTGTTSIITPTSGGSVTDAAGNVWTLDNGGNLLQNGVDVEGGGGTSGLTVINGVIWAQDATSGTWYIYQNGTFVSQGTNTPTNTGTITPTIPTVPTPPTPTRPTVPSTPTAPITATGQFKMQNGKIIDPDGNVFVARGINVYDTSTGSVSTSAACTPLLTLFPGVNFIRLACYDYNDPSFYQTFINQVTAKKIVVELEHHVGAGGGVTPLSGSDLDAENAFFSALASAYKTNPYVWFGTLNEPGGPGSTLTAEQVSNYNTIRGQGNNSPIMMEVYSDYSSGSLAYGANNGLIASSYSNMTNIIWDLHYYNWLTNYSADTNTNIAMCEQLVSEAQTITSADGTVPVLIGEYGISTDGENVDAGGTAACLAAQNNPSGCAAWNWYSYAASDNLTDNNNNLTSYGQQVAGYIGTTPASTAITVTPPVAPVTAKPTTWFKSTNILLSNNNMTATSTGSSIAGNTPQTVRSSNSLNSGKVYFEITMQSSTKDFAIGIINTNYNFASKAGIGGDANSMGYYPISPIQAIYVNNNQLTSGPTPDKNGAVLSVAIDFAAKKFWVTSPAMRAAGHTWNNSPTDNPSTGAGGASMAKLNSGPYFICFNNLEGGGVAVLNCGGSRFSRSIPSGFTAWDSLVLKSNTTAQIVPVLANLESINWCSALTLPHMRWYGNSDHVSVYYDTDSYSDAEGQFICSQFLDQVETYYNTLVSWFNGYMPNNSNGLATVENPMGSLINYFIVSNGSMQAGHCSCINADILVDFNSVDRLNLDAIICEFLMELSEVFMPSLTALPDCDLYAVGEGMSNAMSIDLHAGGVGTTVANLAIQWMNETVAGKQRSDFVNTNVLFNTTGTDDTRLVGAGCCTVFFFYLRYQLLYTWPQITAAMNTLPAHASMQQIYQVLSSDSKDPFPTFLSLLNSKYPPSLTIDTQFSPVYLFPIS
jgi:hypothetical protein